MRKSIASVVCPSLEERMTKRSANLTGLVLGCIEANFCKKICVWKLSPRSTQCAEAGALGARLYFLMWGPSNWCDSKSWKWSNNYKNTNCNKFNKGNRPMRLKEFGIYWVLKTVSCQTARFRQSTTMRTSALWIHLLSKYNFDINTQIILRLAREEQNWGKRV